MRASFLMTRIVFFSDMSTTLVFLNIIGACSIKRFFSKRVPGFLPATCQSRTGFVRESCSPNSKHQATTEPADAVGNGFPKPSLTKGNQNEIVPSAVPDVTNTYTP